MKSEKSGLVPLCYRGMDPISEATTSLISYPSNAQEHVQEEATSSSPSWQFLHEDLIVEVLARLPFLSLIRCRRVCKKWNSVITSAGFSDHHQFTPKCVPVYFNAWDGTFTVYNSVLNSWYRHSLAFLQLQVYASSPALCESLSLAASGGGLLLFDTATFGQYFLCNPVTKKWRELKLPRKDWRGNHMPAPPWIRRGRLHQDVVSGRRMLVGIVCGNYDVNYKLVFAGLYAGSLWTTLVYDSRTFSWSRGARIPIEGTDCAFAGRSMCCNGFLYCLIRGDGGDLNHYRVMKYDLDQKIWRQFWIPRYFGPFLELLEHQESILLIVREPARTPLGSNTFYKLQEWNHDDATWLIVLEDLPSVVNGLGQPLCTKFVSGFHRCGHVGNGDLIYEVGFYREEQEKGWRVLLYHHAENYCFWLPDYDVDKRHASWHGWSKFPLGFYSFQPSLRLRV